MKQTMLLKLAPTIEQAQALLDTIHTFNAACDYIAEQAFASQVANKFELQKMTYGELRYYLPFARISWLFVPISKKFLWACVSRS